MSKSSSNSIELLLLGIFKWVVIAAMLLLIIATVLLVGRGAMQLPGASKSPEPARAAPTFALSSEAFLTFLQEQQAKSASSGDVAPAGAPSTLAEDVREAAFRDQAAKLWISVNQYQMACGISPGLSKADFVESLRQTPLKIILEARGSDYAASQDTYVKTVLGDPATIKLCKSGKTGIFFSTLEFHRRNWDLQKNQAKQFEDQETARVKEFRENEVHRIAASQAESYRTLVGAAIAFGLFMSVALVLIFARLESNLRGVHIVVRAPGEGASQRSQ